MLHIESTFVSVSILIYGFIVICIFRANPHTCVYLFLPVKPIGFLPILDFDGISFFPLLRIYLKLVAVSISFIHNVIITIVIARNL